jgi:hypothetical protein
VDAKVAPPAVPAAARTPRPRVQTSAGRGSLVRQAVARLLVFPAIAAEVTPEERAGLNDSEEPGVDLLRALLDDLREHPLQVSAQVIERWLPRPGGEVLPRLLQREEVLGEAAGAAGELKAALVKLADLAVTQRLRQLEERSRERPLNNDELQELQRLTLKLSARKGS